MKPDYDLWQKVVTSNGTKDAHIVMLSYFDGTKYDRGTDKFFAAVVMQCLKRNIETNACELAQDVRYNQPVVNGVPGDIVEYPFGKLHTPENYEKIYSEFNNTKKYNFNFQRALFFPPSLIATQLSARHFNGSWDLRPFFLLLPLTLIADLATLPLHPIAYGINVAILKDSLSDCGDKLKGFLLKGKSKRPEFIRYYYLYQSLSYGIFDYQNPSFQ